MFWKYNYFYSLAVYLLSFVVFFSPIDSYLFLILTTRSALVSRGISNHFRTGSTGGGVYAPYLVWARLKQVNNNLSTTAHCKAPPSSLTQGHPCSTCVFLFNLPPLWSFNQDQFSIRPRPRVNWPGQQLSGPMGHSIPSSFMGCQLVWELVRIAIETNQKDHT